MGLKLNFFFILVIALALLTQPTLTACQGPGWCVAGTLCCSDMQPCQGFCYRTEIIRAKNVKNAIGKLSKAFKRSEKKETE
jgi:hypothetical protein